jgi:hypothetical protein
MTDNKCLLININGLQFPQICNTRIIALCQQHAFEDGMLFLEVSFSRLFFVIQVHFRTRNLTLPSYYGIVIMYSSLRFYTVLYY